MKVGDDHPMNAKSLRMLVAGAALMTGCASYSKADVTEPERTRDASECLH
jgi:hypothetical protein